MRDDPWEDALDVAAAISGWRTVGVVRQDNDLLDSQDDA